MTKTCNARLREHHNNKDWKGNREAKGGGRLKRQRTEDETPEDRSAGPERRGAQRVQPDLDLAVLEGGDRRRWVTRKQHQVDGRDCKRGDRPEPEAPPLPQNNPGERDRNQRLSLLKHVGFREELMLRSQLERLCEQQGRHRLRANPDQDHGEPAPP